MGQDVVLMPSDCKGVKRAIQAYCKNCKKNNWENAFEQCPLELDMLGYLLQRAKGGQI